jgi:hypothetical protein
MLKIRRVFCTLLLVQLVMSLNAEQPAQKVDLDLRKPRAEIRKAVLRYTPVGSRAAVVTDFISSQLQRSGTNAAPVVEAGHAARERQAAKIMRVYLGQYYDQPGVIFLTAPLVSQKEVSVDWLFDDRDILKDVVITKRATVY